jgi:hypothetical protein
LMFDIRESSGGRSVPPEDEGAKLRPLANDASFLTQ